MTKPQYQWGRSVNEYQNAMVFFGGADLHGKLGEPENIDVNGADWHEQKNWNVVPAVKQATGRGGVSLPPVLSVLLGNMYYQARCIQQNNM